MENRYYGTGKIIENDAGYTVKVGGPVFDGTATANGSGQIYILGIKNDTQYLVTLEVNGEVKLYRELWKSGNTSTANEVPISDYTYVMDEGAISGLTEDDVVVARFEPCEVYTTDAFRAAVKKDAPKAEGGGGSGGVLVVNGTLEGTTLTLDKTWQEIADADLAVLKSGLEDATDVSTLSGYGTHETQSGGIAEVTYWVHFGGRAGTLPDLKTDSADGYPSATLK